MGRWAQSKRRGGQREPLAASSPDVEDIDWNLLDNGDGNAQFILNSIPPGSDGLEAQFGVDGLPLTPFDPGTVPGSELIDGSSTLGGHDLSVRLRLTLSGVPVSDWSAQRDVLVTGP